MSLSSEMAETDEVKSLIERLTRGEEVPIYDPEAKSGCHNRLVRLAPIGELSPLDPAMQAKLALELEEAAKIFNGLLPAVATEGGKLYPIRLADILQNIGLKDMLLSSIPD